MMRTPMLREPMLRELMLLVCLLSEVFSPLVSLVSSPRLISRHIGSFFY
jgi:hypothetical protein